MIVQKWVQDVINQIASEKNLPIRTVSDIVMSQFEYTVKEIRSSEDAKPPTYKNILLKYLGTWSYNYKKGYAITNCVGGDLTEFKENKRFTDGKYVRK